MNKTILIVPNDGYEELKIRLQKAIRKKRILFVSLHTCCEELKTELEFIQRQYFVRVGRLIHKDNLLDGEIIKYKNMLSYMLQGFTYEQAKESIENNNDFFQENYTNKNTTYTELPKQEENKINVDKLKDLWKQAVMKFHPDLSLDLQEKKRRESIMKKINQAYTAQDFDKLYDLYTNIYIEPSEEITIESLEKMLINVENKIIKLNKEYLELKKTEWYRWKAKLKKAEKNGIDVFKELESDLQDDIIEKQKIVRVLKKEIEGRTIFV